MYIYAPHSTGELHCYVVDGVCRDITKSIQKSFAVGITSSLSKFSNKLERGASFGQYIRCTTITIKIVIIVLFNYIISQLSY